MLIILGGLPGVGKTTLARALARRLGALHLRIDTIEKTLLRRGIDPGLAGYAIARALAADNLRLGRIVIADSVNPIEESRAAWRLVAIDCGCPKLEAEIFCGDTAKHRRRIETRPADIPGHLLPDWNDVLAREYQPWQADLRIDTAESGIEEALDIMLEGISVARASVSIRPEAERT